SPTGQRREGRTLSENHLPDDHDIDRAPARHVCHFLAGKACWNGPGSAAEYPARYPCREYVRTDDRTGRVSGSVNSLPTPYSSLVYARHPRPVNRSLTPPILAVFSTRIV